MADSTSADILASVQSANAKAYNPDPDMTAFNAEMAANRAAEARNRAASNRPASDGSSGNEFFNTQVNGLGTPSLASPAARKTTPTKATPKAAKKGK